MTQTVERPAPSRATITETTVRFDDDGDPFVETARTRVIAYQGADPRSGAEDAETGDLFLIDTGHDPLSVADLDEHITACRVLRDYIDPHRVMRRRPTPLRTRDTLAETYRRTEVEAREVARTFTAAQVDAQLLAAPLMGADRDRVAAWSRAADILAGPVQGPDGLDRDFDSFEVSWWGQVDRAAWDLRRHFDLHRRLADLVDGEYVGRGGSLAWIDPDGRRAPWQQSDHDALADLEDAGLVSGVEPTELGVAVVEALREQVAAA